MCYFYGLYNFETVTFGQYYSKAYFGHTIVAFREDSQSKEGKKKEKERKKQKAVSKYPMIH